MMQSCHVLAAQTFHQQTYSLITNEVVKGLDGIIEIELGSKVPLAVICVQPPNVVHVKCEECLVGGHA